MTLKEIIDKCSELEVSEKRCISNEYDELVFYNKQTDEWNKIFTDILGPAIKPAGVKPTVDDLDLTKDYGGIYENQTIFKKDFDDVSVIAMFWPWQDNIHTTLKVVLLKK
ncbi:MAG: hypothetical protein ISS47_00235 [Candidatus Omnitrophica bacterium]|nr:hypothetical protein [Candidatus Omnitrophota bacterium]